MPEITAPEYMRIPEDRARHLACDAILCPAQIEIFRRFKNMETLILRRDVMFYDGKLITPVHYERYEEYEPLLKRRMEEYAAEKGLRFKGIPIVEYLTAKLFAARFPSDDRGMHPQLL